MYALKDRLSDSYVQEERMAKKVKTAKKRRPGRRRVTYRPTFLRHWRAHRDMSLYELANLVGSTHATLSRLERGIHPYSQQLLEKLAEALDTDVSAILMYPPEGVEDIRNIWEQATREERQQLIDIAKALVKPNQ